MNMMMKMMMIKDRRDIRPLLVKFGVALAISFAGFLYSRVRTKRIKPPDSPPSVSDSDGKVYEGRSKIKEDPQPETDSVSIDTYGKPCIRVCVDNSSMNTSPSVRCNGDKEGLLLPEFDQLVREFDMNTANCIVTSPKADVETFKIKKDPPPKSIRSFERDYYEQEIENLKNRIRFLRERERKLEVQLLKYYGVKEQESVFIELQNRLKLNNIEAKLFSMRIESLEADNKRLEAQVADHSKIVCELEAANMKIKQLKRKIRHEAEQSKEQILELTQRVAKLRCPDHENGNSGSDVCSELQTLKDLEHEAEELRKSNEKLQKENGDLSQRLESTQILANSILEYPEREELCKEMLHLREENENLSNEMERLQSDRCADAEELVYLRWVNACLRYELRNYHPPPGKTIARDLSKSLSPNSERKAKQLILQYANTKDGDKEPSIVDFDFDHDQWPSSQPSYLTDEPDNSPCSSSTKKHHFKKMKFFAKLRRLIRGKYGHHHHQSGQSSIIRPLSVDDIGRKFFYESPHHNSCGGEIGTDDQRSESQSPMLASSSQNSNNSSLEYKPLTTLAEEDAKDIKSANTTSDSGSPRGGVRFVLGRGSASSSPLDYRPEQEAEDGQRAELVKYAEALRDSRWVQRTHKKSASFSVG